MGLSFFKNTFLILVMICFSCGSKTSKNRETSSVGIQDTISVPESLQKKIVLGLEQPELYFPLLKNKKVGVVANQTSIGNFEATIYPPNGISAKEVRAQHLVDYLKNNGIQVTKVYAPEHGFRGTADAGENIQDGVDAKTGTPIISIYGDNKKPTPKQLENIDMMIFDIQDVGARFYTYISTLHYVMEACAEAGIPLLILDRPNPNGHYIDGPILEPEYQSFVGMHPVPVVHGMTIGEYAKMINGEGWLKNVVKCELIVIPLKNYTHQTEYSLPVKPSPNLPNDTSINLYPSLCFFEGTIVSAGRGTDMQFQVFGAPSLPAEYYPFAFTPQANEGAKYPKFKGELCHGKDLHETKRLDRLNLDWLIDAYVAHGKKKDFFIKFFTNLAGTKKLQQQIEKGLTAREIRKTWLDGLTKYDKMRAPYLLYEK